MSRSDASAGGQHGGHNWRSFVSSERSSIGFLGLGEMSVMRSKTNPLNFLQCDVVGRPVVQFRGARRLVGCDVGGRFERTAILQVDGDAGGASSFEEIEMAAASARQRKHPRPPFSREVRKNDDDDGGAKNSKDGREEQRVKAGHGDEVIRHRRLRSRNLRHQSRGPPCRLPAGHGRSWHRGRRQEGVGRGFRFLPASLQARSGSAVERR